MRHFNYYAAAAQKFKELYALKFDGVNDYLQSANTFAQWERTQPWTLFCKMKNYNDGVVYSSALNLSANLSDFRGIIIRRNTGTWQVAMRNGLPFSNNFVIWPDPVVSYNEITLQITYDGSNTAAGHKLYVNGVELTQTTPQPRNSDTIINTANRFYISRFHQNLFAGLENCEVLETSFVDYVKSITELTTDLQAGMDLTANPLSPTYDPTKQLLHVAPIYKTYIKSLDSTQTFQAFQGGNPLNISLFGYPNPLVLDTNLIKI